MRLFRGSAHCSGPTWRTIGDVAWRRSIANCGFWREQVRRRRSVPCRWIAHFRWLVGDGMDLTLVFCSESWRWRSLCGAVGINSRRLDYAAEMCSRCRIACSKWHSRPSGAQFESTGGRIDHFVLPIDRVVALERRGAGRGPNRPVQIFDFLVDDHCPIEAALRRRFDRDLAAIADRLQRRHQPIAQIRRTELDRLL